MLANLPRIATLLVETPGAVLLRINAAVTGLVLTCPVHYISLSSGCMPSAIKATASSLYWTLLPSSHVPDMTWVLSPELRRVVAAAWGLPPEIDAADMTIASNRRTEAFMAYMNAVGNALLLIMAHRRRRQRHLPCEIWLLTLGIVDHPYLQGLRFKW
jgi:hypothetical protein